MAGRGASQEALPRRAWERSITAVWLVQRKGQQTPMAKAFVELLTRKALV